MHKGSRWAAGLLVLLIAGCVGVGKAAPPPQADSPGTGARVAVRRGRLPGLTSPPYGLGARGKRLEPFVAPAQQEQLDKLAPDAAVDSATCQYKATAGALPLLLSDVMLFRGAAGATQAEAVYRQNHDAVAGSIDFAEVPGLGDGAFAYFSLNALHVKVRSGNAYVSQWVTLGSEAAAGLDRLQPLQPQVPTLTLLVEQALTTLR